MRSVREIYTDKILDEQKKIEKAIEEKQRLVELNRQECFGDINKFLLENLRNIHLTAHRSNIHDDWVVLFSDEQDTDEMTKFISECIDANNYDPTMYPYGHGSFSLYLYDDKIEVYAKDKYSKLQITVRDMSILDKFIDEYKITKLSLGDIEEHIQEYEKNLKQLKNIQTKFK